MPPPLYNAVALCHHSSFVLSPTFFYSSSMPSDYYGILSYCRRIVQSLFISAIVLCRQSLQYLQIKIRTIYFYTVLVSISYILLSLMLIVLFDLSILFQKVYIYLAIQNLHGLLRIYVKILVAKSNILFNSITSG